MAKRPPQEDQEEIGTEAEIPAPAKAAPADEEVEFDEMSSAELNDLASQSPNVLLENKTDNPLTIRRKVRGPKDKDGNRKVVNTKVLTLGAACDWGEEDRDKYPAPKKKIARKEWALMLKERGNQEALNGMMAAGDLIAYPMP